MLVLRMRVVTVRVKALSRLRVPVDIVQGVEHDPVSWRVTELPMMLRVCVPSLMATPAFTAFPHHGQLEGH